VQKRGGEGLEMWNAIEETGFKKESGEVGKKKLQRWKSRRMRTWPLPYFLVRDQNFNFDF
jgi:hypothetical protein